MRWVVVLIIAASICWVAHAWVALLFVGGYLLAHRIESLQDRVHELERERRTEDDHWEDEAELELSTSIVQALSERREKPAEPEPSPGPEPEPDPNSVEGVLRQIAREEEQGPFHRPGQRASGSASTWAVIAWIALVAVGAWFLLGAEKPPSR